MKKGIIAGIGVLIIVSVSVFILVSKGKSDFEVERILPEKPFYYVRINNLSGQKEAFLQSSFWRAISQIDYGSLLSYRNVGEERIKEIDKVFDQASTIWSKFLIEEFFGQDAALAMYRFKVDVNFDSEYSEEMMSSIFAKLLKNMYIVTKASPDAQIVEFFSRLTGASSDQITQEESEYSEIKIQLLTISDLPEKLFYFKIKDYYVIGFSQESAENAINAYRKTSPSLAYDPQFLTLKENYKKSHDIFGFVNLSILSELVYFLEGKSMAVMKKNNTLSASEQEEITKSFQQFIDMYRNLGYLGFSAQWGEISEIKNVALFDPSTAHENFKRFLCAPRENKNIQFTPANTIGYLSSSCWDWAYYWKTIKAAMPVTPESNSIEKVEKSLGVSIENDIIASLGDEIGGYLTEVHNLKGFPIPELAIFVQLKNEEKMADFMGKLMQKTPMLPQEENYNGINIKYFLLPIVEGIEPAYAFINGYFVMSLQRELLKKSVDAFKNGTALSSNEDYKAVQTNVGSKYNHTVFLHVERFMDAFKDVIDFGNDWVEEQETQRLAFIEGAKKRLAETKEEQVQIEEKLKELANSRDTLANEVEALLANGEDATSKKAELAALDSQITIEQKTSEDIGMQIEKVESTMVSVDKTNISKEERDFYRKGFVYPVIDALKSITVFESKTKNNESSVESLMQFKVK